MDESTAVRILELHESIEAHEGDGDPNGVLPGLYRRLAAEYVNTGQLRTARILLDTAARRRKTA